MAFRQRHQFFVPPCRKNDDRRTTPSAPCWAKVAKAGSKSLSVAAIRDMQAPATGTRHRALLDRSSSLLGACVIRISLSAAPVLERAHSKGAPPLRLIWRPSSALDRVTPALPPIEAGDKAERDWIVAATEDDRNRGRRRLRSDGHIRGSGCNNDAGLLVNQLARQRRQTIVTVLCPAVFDGSISTIDIAGFVQALVHGAKKVRESSGRRAAKKPDNRRFFLCVFRR